MATNVKDCKFLRLPVELLSMILSHLSDGYEVLRCRLVRLTHKMRLVVFAINRFARSGF